MATLHLVYEKARAPSTRIRLEQMAPYLAERGWPCALAAYPRGPVARRAFASRLAPGDLVLIHRARPTRREAAWWRALPVRRVYDFDDAVWCGRRGGPAGLLSRRRRGAGFRRALACADAASCGNRFLAAQCGALPTAVVPSAVALDVPQHAPRGEATTPLRVGWVGRSSNLRYVRAIAPALAALARRIPLEVVCVSDAPLALAGCPVVNVPWSREQEAIQVAGFDAGIMPLAPDGPWARGKCAYKLLQYMAAGVPAVGTRVGMNAELIEDGANGLLAGGPREWETQLARLAADPALRARLGAAGRATARDYGYAAVADRLCALLAEVAAAKTASR